MPPNTNANNNVNAYQADHVSTDGSSTAWKQKANAVPENSSAGPAYYYSVEHISTFGNSPENRDTRFGTALSFVMFW
ncbi:hypothetical protein Clacol_009431 [Clathrus columnatus]|uniref:Uncharacterized protein n=1 Tax=Clathrus columnatus TaxID=1419009 RepID=A0AAV5AS29_9AGAM|nr:hypothetical protein Clacol_009431 [Clathrus columnatus]